MSREDPQFRIRLPVELKGKVEESAKINNRSLNAEIVHRLNASFLSEISSDELISAQDALEIISKAKDELSGVIFKRTFAEINRKVRMGHTSFSIDLTDLELDGLNENDFESVFSLTLERLKELGYVVWEKTWDSQGFMCAIPE